MSYSSKKYPRNKNMIKIKIVKNGLDLHHPPPQKKKISETFMFWRIPLIILKRSKKNLVISEVK